MFWERVLSLRPMSSHAAAPMHDPDALELHHAWSGLAGPTRVIDLQQCPSMDEFKSQVLTSKFFVSCRSHCSIYPGTAEDRAA
jgi:hypothetical protein